MKNDTKIYKIERNNTLINVMLDRDLANFYEVETKNLNKMAKRNAYKFEGESFELTAEENLRFQSVFTGNNIHKIRYLPKVYTEVGALTFAGLMSTPKAVEIFKVILNTFFAFKKLSEMKAFANQADVMDLRNRVSKLEDQMSFQKPPLYIGTNSGPILINQGKMTFNSLPDIYRVIGQDIESSENKEHIEVLNKILEQVSKKDSKVLDTLSGLSSVSGVSGLLIMQHFDKIKDFIVNFIK